MNRCPAGRRGRSRQRAIKDDVRVQIGIEMVVLAVVPVTSRGYAPSVLQTTSMLSVASGAELKVICPAIGSDSV